MNNVLIGYARVSSEEQAQHGCSISAQRDILNGYAAMNETTIDIYEDPGFSGKDTNRPAMRRLLDRCRAGGVSAVVVWKLDRLSRSLRDTLAIIEDILQPQHISLVSVTEKIDTSTPSGRMMLNLLASFAQLEREQDSDRVVMAHKHLAHDCRYLGGHIPLGYRVDADKHYQLDPILAPVARHVFDLYLARAGYKVIMDYLNGPEIFPLTGRKRPFRKPDLSFMMQNPVYSGTYVRKLGADPRHRITAPEVISIPGGVPALLSPEEWERVLQIRTENGKAMAMYKAKSNYPLTGLVYCSVCGGRMFLNHGGKTRARESERYYTCKNKCVKPARVEAAEKATFDALIWFSEHLEELRQSCEIANGFSDQAEQEKAPRKEEIEKQIADNRKKAAQITAFIAKNGASAPVSLMDELTAIDEQNAALSAQMDKLARPVARYDAEKTISAVAAAVDAIKKGPPEQLKTTVQAAVYRVIVSPDDFDVRLAWHTFGGDEPPRNVCHILPRKNYTRFGRHYSSPGSAGC